MSSLSHAMEERNPPLTDKQEKGKEKECETDTSSSESMTLKQLAEYAQEIKQTVVDGFKNGEIKEKFKAHIEECKNEKLERYIKTGMIPKQFEERVERMIGEQFQFRLYAPYIHRFRPHQRWLVAHIKGGVAPARA